MTAAKPESIRASRARRPGGRAALRRLRHFLAFGAPGLIVFAGIVLVPTGMTLWSSLTSANSFSTNSRFIGWQNFAYLAQDPGFRQALGNTLLLAALVTAVPNLLGLAIALLLDSQGWAFNAMRAVFFVPVVLSSVVVSVIWESMLTHDGFVNRLLHGAGVRATPGWLSDPHLALYSVATIISWQSLGTCVVIYLAGLQGVPGELREAAEIDGAGPILRFRRVTWPLLAPACTITTVLALISGFKAYDQIQVITGGGPGAGTTETLVFDIVQTGIDGSQVGYAAAMAAVLLVLVAAVSIVVLRLLQRREVML